jgi:hypothetical protein
MVDDIAKMRREIEDWRANRVARGLPPSPPENFVPCEVGYLLMERHKHLFDFFVKYTTLCNDANEKIPLDVSKFDQYEVDLRLLDETIGGEVLAAFSTGISCAIGTVKRADDLSTIEYIRRLYSSLKLAKLGKNTLFGEVVYDFKLNSTENNALFQQVSESYKLYKSDDVLFEAELARLRAHYESIKHLY